MEHTVSYPKSFLRTSYDRKGISEKNPLLPEKGYFITVTSVGTMAEGTERKAKKHGMNETDKLVLLSEYKA